MGQNQSKIVPVDVQGIQRQDVEFKAYKDMKGHGPTSKDDLKQDSTSKDKGSTSRKTWRGMPTKKAVQETQTFKGSNLRITMLKCDDGNGGTFNHMVL